MQLGYSWIVGYEKDVGRDKRQPLKMRQCSREHLTSKVTKELDSARRLLQKITNLELTFEFIKNKSENERKPYFGLQKVKWKIKILTLFNLNFNLI